MADAAGQHVMASIGKLVRSGSNIYLANLSNALTSYAFWLLVSRIAGPDVLGISSAVASLSGLIAGALSLGVPLVIQRNVASCVARGGVDCARANYWTLAIVQALVYTAAAGALLAMGSTGVGFSRYTPEMLRVASILVLLSGLGQAPGAGLTAMLETGKVLVATVAGNAAKLAVGVGLAAAGYGWPGVLAGYIAQAGVFLALTSTVILRRLRPTLRLDTSVLRSSFTAGLSAWLPGFIVLTGQWLSILAVYGYTSPAETGQYYAAYAVASMLAGIPGIVLGTLLPVLSGVGHSREALAGEAARLALAAVTPVAVFVAFHPGMVLSLIGEAYVGGAAALSLLSLTAPVSVVTSTISNLAFAKGRYGLVLAVGLAQSTVTITLYHITIPALGQLGAALAVLAGSITGLAAAVAVSGSLGYKHDVPTYLKVALAPLALAAPTLDPRLSNWPTVIAAGLASYIAYGRLRVIRRSDAREIARAYLAPETFERVRERLRPALSLVLPPE